MKKLTILLLIITCLIVLYLSNCTTTYHTTKVVEKKKIVGKITRYKLQQYCPDVFFYGEFNPTNNYFKLISRNDSIDKCEFYTHDRIHLFKK